MIVKKKRKWLAAGSLVLTFALLWAISALLWGRTPASLVAPIAPFYFGVLELLRLDLIVGFISLIVGFVMVGSVISALSWPSETFVVLGAHAGIVGYYMWNFVLLSIGV
jgi:hypothetical protein